MISRGADLELAGASDAAYHSKNKELGQYIHDNYRHICNDKLKFWLEMDDAIAEIFKSIENGDIDNVTRLVDENPELDTSAIAVWNKITRKDDCFLYSAIYYDQLDILKLLVERGKTPACIIESNNLGNSFNLIDFMCHMGRDNGAMMKYLIELGIHINEKLIEHMHRQQKFNVLRELVMAGAADGIDDNLYKMKLLKSISLNTTPSK